MKHFILSISIFLLACNSLQATEITSGKVYKIASYFAEGKSLSVANSSLDNNAAIVTWTETGVNAQRWRITKDEASELYFLTNVYSEKVLHVTGAVSSATIDQFRNDASKSCKWRITPVDDANGENCFYLSPSSELGGIRYYLEVQTGDEGSGVKAKQKSEGAGSNRQRWILEEAGDIPNAVTPALRKEAMDQWKALYYKDINTNQAILGAGGWWGDAEMFEVILDAYETGNDPVYKEIFGKLYTNFLVRNGSTWTNNDFNDDIAWMVIACTRAYLLFGEQTYLTRATTNFNLMYNRALLPSGMLRWKERDASLTNQTNSCINGPAEVAACYLAMATNDEAYYEKAKALYALQRQYLFVPSTGQVYDCFTWVNNTPSNYSHWASTYNQGTFMGAALMLYAHYSAQQYREDALKIMEYTQKNLCDANGIIKVCQVANGDLAGFKGILMRYVRRLINDLDANEYAAWMKKNALHAYNNRNSAGITHSSWLSKTPETYISEPDPFGASTSVSAIVNTPIDTPTTIEEIKPANKQLDFTVYPNPAKESIYIDSPENGQLSIYTVLGKLLNHYPLKTGLTSFNITGFEKGVYILNVKSATNETSKRIIKQ
ncbi:hypothetical protein FACS189413_17780 [Bacteroidia bacterium]|nr:hypothetical protein FACS189413_17780 [Bacteroidia bacterium]